MVQVTVCRSGELQGLEANLVESLVIDTEGLIGVLDELVDRKRRVVWLKNAVEQIDRDVTTCAPTSTTVSDTLGLGTTEYVAIIRSGYSSRILEMRRVPIPAPVPPPNECVIWKPGTVFIPAQLDFEMTTYPAGRPCPQPPCGQRQEPSRQVRHPPCNLKCETISFCIPS